MCFCMKHMLYSADSNLGGSNAVYNAYTSVIAVDGGVDFLVYHFQTNQ